MIVNKINVPKNYNLLGVNSRWFFSSQLTLKNYKPNYYILRIEEIDNKVLNIPAHNKICGQAEPVPNFRK